MEMIDNAIYSALELSTSPQTQNDDRPQQKGKLTKLVWKTLLSYHRLRDERETELSLE